MHTGLHTVLSLKIGTDTDTVTYTGTDTMVKVITQHALQEYMHMSAGQC